MKPIIKELVKGALFLVICWAALVALGALAKITIVSVRFGWRLL